MKRAAPSCRVDVGEGEWFRRALLHQGKGMEPDAGGVRIRGRPLFLCPFSHTPIPTWRVPVIQFSASRWKARLCTSPAARRN